MRIPFLLIVLLFVFSVATAFAAIELAPRGKNPVLLSDVYVYDGIPFVAADDALAAVSLRGHWNSIKHVYRIKTARGWAEITPGSSFLKFRGNYYPIENKPRFIDGRLRVSEDFLVTQLPLLIDRSVYYRNLDPLPAQKVSGENPLERLFSFLLRKKQRTAGPRLNAVAIDPGHGGLDNGVIAAGGLREKDVNLQLARRLSKLLKMNFGMPVYLSRDDDYELTPEQRVAPAAREDVDLWLLLHAQAAFGPQVQGVALLIRPEHAAGETAAGDQSDSMRLAKALVRSLVDAQIPVAGIFQTPLLPLGTGDLPTVQVEAGYLSNSEDLARLRDPQQQETLVQALYQGIQDFVQQKEEMQ